MLFDLKLSDGFWNQINREARHINIVLAAGEIQVRFVSKKGANYQTKMVQGMALELPKFDRVEIKGETDQQIKVWVSDVPLSYSPDSSRQVGSNALRSSVGYVYSGYPHALLPAEIGRNKITLTPQQDIYIGGTNLNTKNGVLLKAGQVFSMATQGAVYALETTGNFQPYFTALVPPSEILNKLGETPLNEQPTLKIYHENRDRTRGWGFRGSQNQTAFLYEYDPATREPTGFSASFGSNQFYTSSYRQRGDLLVNWNNTYLRIFDMNTGTFEMSYPSIGNGEKIQAYAFNGQYEYVATNAGVVHRRLIGQPDENWAQYADAVPITMGNLYALRGFDVLSTGRIIWANTEQLWFKDEGGVWTQGNYYGEAVTGADNVSQMQIDHSSDALYAIEKDAVVVSFDGGESWQTEYSYTDNLDFNGRAPTRMEVLNGAILICGIEGYGYRDPISGTWTTRDLPFGQRNAARCCLNLSGTAYFHLQANDQRYETSLFLDGRGTPSPVGGLPVSIMAEVN